MSSSPPNSSWTRCSTSHNSEANITQTAFHAAYTPVSYGARLIFTEDYRLTQNYSPADGLVDTSVNTLELGGGYRGYHLDGYL